MFVWLVCFAPQDEVFWLTSLIAQLVEKADRDVKSYAHAYAEKKSALSSIHRKTGGNLLVCSLNTIITPQVVAQG